MSAEESGKALSGLEKAEAITFDLHSPYLKILANSTINEDRFRSTGLPEAVQKINCLRSVKRLTAIDIKLHIALDSPEMESNVRCDDPKYAGPGIPMAELELGRDKAGHTNLL